jgi:hypothetical protein
VVFDAELQSVRERAAGCDAMFEEFNQWPLDSYFSFNGLRAL